MSTTESLEERIECDHDVAIVGGGPAGCAVGVFTARYGLDTVIFDRGRSSIQRCAHLENYLGFPAGVDIETLYGLMHDHAEEAGCEIVPDLVESVERADDGRRTPAAEPTGATGSGDGEGFVIERQEGDSVTARRVVAATRYDGEYMRGLDDDAAMFETHEHDGETHEHFDGEYADHDGSTPVEGLYVASPSIEDRQALIAAGRGARVGHRVIEDSRRERGYPEAVADHYDWMRQESELDDEWSDRDRWREWFDDQLSDDHDIDDDRRVELRERDIDRSFESYLADEVIEQRAERGQKRLLEHVDDELVLEAARELEADRHVSEAGD
ncbi:NAD(P)/FAD-dependent oxidoreductase [Natrinema salsiterrestre]|uniref:NAD(P)/FAD-dependent oxidoreductase n=1 Tax=Natrinema salsiterrestre TaxID=2950540 RepID=A0A9Q4L1U9_9EURY|nr:NAD(P)/FAD-dependent oxidoreductase [Natrinema salsiterrestre]MDF9744395.1 NAD(P)/FAD-dependent oxidoreductase [Natrinema salsiterrestre]